MDRLGLTWVLVDGRPRCVSDFAALSPRQRPRPSCPLCGRGLTLKLGRIRRHHAAHAPNDVCRATQPETALHIDAKLYLAEQLTSAIASDPTLVIRRRCEGTPLETCDAVRDEEWVRDWDEVVVEAGGAADRYRPDILLRKGGVPLAAIEVLVSHRVPNEKAAALEGAGLPWIEIRARPELLDGNTAWKASRPLPVERVGRRDTSRTWRCDAHVRRSRRLRGARVVDVYREGGVHLRAIYRVDQQTVEDAVVALVLSRDNREVASHPCDDTAQAQRIAWGALRLAFTEDVRRVGGEGTGFMDSPMRWASGDSAANLVEEAVLDVRYGDPTPLVTRYPRRWYFARAEGRWFLPADMRDVRWDRPEHDAFAAHPAWTASRAVVRERPVPRDAWQGVIFASRTSAAAFGVSAATVPNGPIAVVELESGDGGLTRRALVVLTASVDDEVVRDVERSLDADHIEHLWLSHPMDWKGSRSDLPWAAAARDARGRHVVLVDGVGVFRASAFAQAFRRGDPKVRPTAVQARMVARASGLREKR
ncbi:MAG: competence protein CoiA family protein [Gemmatimonadaceae bacterium]